MQKRFENYFVKALHDAKIQELTESYSKRGFKADKNVPIGNQEVDLLLRHPTENKTLVFEVKILPLDREGVDGIEYLRKKLEELGYEFRLVTVARPTEYKIEIDWFAEAVSVYIANNPPQDIEREATHVYYEEVSADIESIIINGTEAQVRATGTISVELQFGSDSDLDKDIGLVISDGFPFEGEFELDLSDKTIISASIAIDDSEWRFYEYHIFDS